MGGRERGLHAYPECGSCGSVVSRRFHRAFTPMPAAGFRSIVPPDEVPLGRGEVVVMTQLENEMGAPCLRKGLRRTCARVSLLIFGVLALLPAAGASAAQHARAVPHGAPPFGHQYTAVCPNVPGKAHCLALVVTSGGARAAVVRDVPFGYGPVDLQTAYNLTSLSASGGAGQTVAIVDAYDDPAAESDLATYRSTYGLSACTTANGCFEKVDQRGGTSYPVTDLGWSEEISLDLDMVSAIAPNAKILLVEGDSDSLADLAAAVNEAAALGATQISNSYGGSEAGSSFASAYDHPGIAITASTGDCGYNNESSVDSCASIPAGASFPQQRQPSRRSVARRYSRPHLAPKARGRARAVGARPCSPSPRGSPTRTVRSEWRAISPPSRTRPLV